MLKFQIIRGKQKAFITVDAVWDGVAPIQYEGDKSLVEYLKQKVPTMYGLYGHKLGDVTTPADLHLALNEYDYLFNSLTIVEGTIKEVIKAEFPDDAQT